MDFLKNTYNFLSVTLLEFAKLFFEKTGLPVIHIVEGTKKFRIFFYGFFPKLKLSTSPY